jgi:hypothetical protein
MEETLMHPVHQGFLLVPARGMRAFGDVVTSGKQLLPVVRRA